MSHTRKDEAPILLEEPEITGRYVELDGYTVSFETFHTDIDPAPLFRGLPDDRCQCPHWGIVVSGRLEVRYADREETFTAGDAYYMPPGHLPHPSRRDRGGRVQPDRASCRRRWPWWARTWPPRRSAGAVMTTTATPTGTRHRARLADTFVAFLETGERPGAGCSPRTCSATSRMPQWRLQAAGRRRRSSRCGTHGHPGPGRVPAARFDPTPTGFVLEVEEAWDADGEHWYCRELFRADVGDGAISQLSVYCTGDWDAARGRGARAAVTMTRP